MWLPLKSRAERLGKECWAGAGWRGLLLGRREPVPAPGSALLSPLACGACGELGESSCLGSR